MTCGFTGCVRTPDAIGMFCKVHGQEIAETMARRVEDALDVASTLYLGRTGFPERRLLEHQAAHGRDHLVVIHWAASWPEAEHFEELIIDRFRKFTRLQNIDDASSGRHGSPWNALYLSFALKQSVARLPAALDVSDLHWRHRLWPNPQTPAPPVLIRTPLTKAAAAEVLAVWNPRLASRRKVTEPSASAPPARGSDRPARR